MSDLPAAAGALALEPPDPRLGSSVAGFVLARRVAQTPWAAVYEAHRGAERAAVKIHLTGAGSAELHERIRREREAHARIAHPCVARLREWGRLPDGATFLVSDWIAGTSLEERLAAGPLPWPTLRRVVAAIGRGLAAIHAAGIVHRDLKPSNVMLPAAGRPAAVILDFGHSLWVDEERLTDQGVILGSAAYMAPEQAAGRPLDGRTDLYALGVILYQALTGGLPFDYPSSAEVLRAHQCEVVTPPGRRAPDRPIPGGAEALCLWLLAKDPAQRVPNARVLAITLGALESGPVAEERSA